MVDMMKLEGDLRTGRLVTDTGKKAVIITPVFRLSFPRLDEPRKHEKSKYPKFSTRMIWNGSNDEAIARVDLDSVVRAAVTSVARYSKIGFKGNAGANPLLEGIKYDSEDNPYDGYDEWCTHATASKSAKNPSARVQCFDASGVDDRATPIEPSELDGGCYCRAQIEVYPWIGDGTKKVCFGLAWVQRVDRGTPFGASEIDYEAPPVIPGADAVTAPGGFDSF